ncbi:glycerate kinase [Chloroflexota bacterium]|nr:glycerate kinase [Chloroflexota bacterium]
MALITTESFENRVLHRNGQMGEAAKVVMAAALNAVDPYSCVQDHIKRDENAIEFNGERVELAEIDRIFLVGVGKASVPMTMAVLDGLDDLIAKAFAVTKDAKFLEMNGFLDKLEVFQGGHPVPSEASVQATREVLNRIPSLTERDLVIAAISGGGSALFTDPVEGITLADLQAMTTLLLKSGADIQEINTIRKHLDMVKGGRLAARWAPARIQTLILSDVIGDDLDMIASGPTVADPTTFEDAWAIVEKYHLQQLMPKPVRDVLKSGLVGKLPETVKPSDFDSMPVSNHLVGTNTLAALAAKKQAEKLGFNAKVLTTILTGLTGEVAIGLGELILVETVIRKDEAWPKCLILGGETTVNVTGTGKGGRNQDLVVRMVKFLAEKEGMLFISLATDGDDGPTDAAGAVADGQVYQEGAEKLGLNIEEYIANNDAYEYLKQTGCLLMTGATGTNVNDLIFIFIDKGDWVYAADEI